MRGFFYRGKPTISLVIRAKKPFNHLEDVLHLSRLYAPASETVWIGPHLRQIIAKLEMNVGPLRQPYPRTRLGGCVSVIPSVALLSDLINQHGVYNIPTEQTRKDNSCNRPRYCQITEGIINKKIAELITTFICQILIIKFINVKTLTYVEF